MKNCPRRWRRLERSSYVERNRAVFENGAASAQLDDGQPVNATAVFSAASSLLGDITKIVARIERIRSQNAIAMPELYRVMREMGRVVETFVRDPETLERITPGWLGIRVGLGAA